MEQLPVRFPALDGRVLAGTVTTGDVEPRAAVLILSALGVPHRFYHRFAGHLADRGYATFSFDYRGVGASQDRPLRDDPAALLDWARLDIPAAIDAARARWPGLPLHAIGHSFGGQSFGLHDRAGTFERVVIVAAGSGDLTVYPLALRWRYHALLAAGAPAVALVGYAPAWMGIGEDLPAGVLRQWSRWCRTRGYARGAPEVGPTHYADLTAPMLFIELPGDTMVPPGAAAELRSWYTGAAVEHQVVAAEELPADLQGHFAAFKGGGQAMWARIVAFFDR